MATPTATASTSTFEIAPKSDFTPLESNWYVLTLLAYKIRDKDPDKYHNAPWRDVEFDFDVAVPDEVRERLELGDGQIKRKVWAAIPKTFTDKATMVQIGIALGKFEVVNGSADGVKVDLDEWLGAKCRGNVIEVHKADGTLGDKVDGFAPYRRGAANQVAGKPSAPKPATRQAPPPEEGDDDSIPF